MPISYWWLTLSVAYVKVKADLQKKEFHLKCSRKAIFRIGFNVLLFPSEIQTEPLKYQLVFDQS